jgi:hypothetical protein
MHKHGDKTSLKPYRTRADGWQTAGLCLLLALWAAGLGASLLATAGASTLP